jgi:hypothetical protein
VLPCHAVPPFFHRKLSVLISSSYITDYLNKPETRELLNVDSSAGNFTSCSDKVATAFNQNLDMYHQTQFYVAELLERGIKVLIYVGTYDWICNWVRRLVRYLENVSLMCPIPGWERALHACYGMVRAEELHLAEAARVES